MDLEDWQIHAIRAWEISGILAKELYKQRKRLDRSKTVNSDGRSVRKIDGRSLRGIISTIDNVLALIPEKGTILKEELYRKLRGVVARDDIRQFVDQLLREERISVCKIPNPGRKPSTAYARKEPIQKEESSRES